MEFAYRVCLFIDGIKSRKLDEIYGFDERVRHQHMMELDHLMDERHKMSNILHLKSVSNGDFFKMIFEGELR